MKRLLTIVVVLLSTTVLAGTQESVDSLKARADKVRPKERVELYTKIAERQLDAFDKAYNGGTVKEAQEALADIVTYGVQAAKMSGESGKRMKQTEIALRKMTGRLEAVRKTLDVDDRPPVVEGIQKLEAARNELLNRMFRK